MRIRGVDRALKAIFQAVGCLGAVRMNERLLNLYWQLLVALLAGDVIVGIVWLFRYNNIATNLRSDLKNRLNNEYGFDYIFQTIWDKIQSENQCCGVDGPYDYNMTLWLAKVHSDFSSNAMLVPNSCCRMSSNKNIPLDYSCVDSYSEDKIYTFGCYDSILHWLQRSANILCVLGFCVISFLKLCFVCILRYEIKEMIQKIQVLKGTTDCDQTPLHELEAYLPRPSMQQDSQQTLLMKQSPQSTNYRQSHRYDRDSLVAHSRQTSKEVTSTNFGTNKSTNGNNNEVKNKRQSLV
ncbi:tetraspanin-1-like protein [Dinothrombium tinctorium]|uniref:Tetraspanin-1-like protein n=1 Tax=Dinothrombium tinctorium TaxID=1965070 RepID=A0A443RHJ7_9ACAR|nr:tetraspanin-1-like protein [Dinothrombium tinctorium]